MTDIIDINTFKKIKAYQETPLGEFESLMMEAENIMEELQDLCIRNPDMAADNLEKLDQIVLFALGAEFVGRVRESRRPKQ